jgi:outer membrane immunogenic protein
MRFVCFAVASILATATVPASAADLRRPVTKAPVAVPYTNWTGFYIGAHVCGAWGTSSDFSTVSNPALDTGSHDFDGFIGGGQIGFNYQVGSVVFGVEADASFADLTGSHISIIDAGDSYATKVDHLGTITGRIGYAVSRALLYVKGGGAWIHTEHSFSFGASNPFNTSDDTRWGWTIGGGLEYALLPNWSAKIEYGYLDFGTDQLDFLCGANCAPAVQTRNVDQHLHTVKFGVNYRFGPVGTAY